MLRNISELNISKKHRQQLDRALQRRSNTFGDMWLAPSFESKVEAYPHFFRHEAGSFMHFDLSDLLDQHIPEKGPEDWTGFFSDAVLFTNPMRFGEFDPSKRVPGQHSGGTPPGERVANSGWLTLTYEVDAETRSDLEMQLGWFAGKPESCAFTPVHRAFSQYADYRGYSAVFSGNKSLHIHLVFDIRHLNRELLPNKPRYRALWSSDVLDSLLGPLHRKAWFEGAGILQKHLGTAAVFDTRLSSYVQKKRSPWGVRTLTKGSELHGFDPGDQFQQVVVQERIAKRILAPPNASAFIRSENARNLSAPLRSSTRCPSAKIIDTEPSSVVLSEFERYLRQHGWDEYPKPVKLCFDGDCNIVYFQNAADDVHPSTLVRGDYRRLLGAGKAAPRSPVFLPNELTLDESLSLLPSVQGSKSTLSWSKQRSLQMGKPLSKATDIQSARSLSSPLLLHKASQRGPTLVQGPEGMGKTHTLMSAIYDLALDDPQLLKGFTGCAARSETQLVDKMSEFKRIHPDAQPVLLPSLKKLYQTARDNTQTKKELQRIDAGRAGFPHLLHLIKTQQPHVFAEMERLRDDVWRNSKNQVVFRPDAVVFLVQGLLKVWPHATFTRAFLHPDCPSDLDPAGMDQCAQQMAFRRVIYDEVSCDDLVAIVPAWKADVAHAANQNCEATTGLPWDESELYNRVQAYETVVRRMGREQDLSYDDIDGLVRLKLNQKDDHVIVNVDDFPFGKGGDDYNFYRKANGEEFYCKERRWVWSLGCPVIILTTEDLPRLLVHGIRARSKKNFSVLNMTYTPHLHRDSVPLVFDERARAQQPGKDWAADLAEQLLKDGFDYVISNSLSPQSKRWDGRVLTHEGARGVNYLKEKRIASILMYPPLRQYTELCAMASAFGIKDPVTVSYRDQIHQSLGRNLGFRYTEGQPDHSHVVFIKPSLFRDLGQLSGHSVPGVGSDRYQFFVADVAIL